MAADDSSNAYRFLTVARDGAVAYVTLNRPDVRNAFGPELIAELTACAAALNAAAEQHDVRAVVLAGAGAAFCAGADAAWMARTLGYTEAENLQDARAMAAMYVALDRLPVPVVGRVHGAAIGGGAGLAAICDMVIAENETVFGFTEVKLGILPAVISPFVLAKIGQSAARALFLTGTRFSAARAREIGLVHQVVAAADLDAQVAKVIADLLSAGPAAVAAAKQLIRDVSAQTASEATITTTRAIAERRVSTEGQEGLKAFLEKRKPRW